MQKIVQKFGGTSVGTIDKIKHVCSLINKEIKTPMNKYKTDLVKIFLEGICSGNNISM